MFSENLTSDIGKSFLQCGQVMSNSPELPDGPKDMSLKIVTSPVDSILVSAVLQ